MMRKVEVADTTGVAMIKIFMYHSSFSCTTRKSEMRGRARVASQERTMIPPLTTIKIILERSMDAHSLQYATCQRKGRGVKPFLSVNLSQCEILTFFQPS